MLGDDPAGLSPAALAKALKGVRFPNQSAKRVHGVLGAIREKVGKVDLSCLKAMETDAAIAWLEALPDTLQGTATAEALQAIVDLDLDMLAAIEPPRGYGRD